MDSAGNLRNMTSIYLRYHETYDNQEKILMLYRQGSRVVNQVWVGSAGGHFEEWELNDAKACVLRELDEELSITEDMICNLELRYITLRRTKGEIRQNYYFFADLKENTAERGLYSKPPEMVSKEGIARWFAHDELLRLEMPYTAKYVMEHYLKTGRHNHNVYVGVADGTQVVFTELPEFD